MTHLCTEYCNVSTLVEDAAMAEKLAASLIESSMCLRMLQCQVSPYPRIHHTRAFLCDTLEEVKKVGEQNQLVWAACIVRCSPETGPQYPAELAGVAGSFKWHTEKESTQGLCV